MSDEQSRHNNEMTSDSSDYEDKRTQSAPSNYDEFDDDATLSFNETQLNRRRKKTEYDPTKETAVFSKDNPLLQRALQQQAHDHNENTTSLGDKREVILLIRGMVERLVMEEGIIYQLGRFDLGTSEEGEVDLTPYGAQDRGVSRIHAQIHLEDGNVFITDLGSTNGTYISSNRLEPNTPAVLRKGDELLLGRLGVQILFR